MSEPHPDVIAGRARCGRCIFYASVDGTCIHQPAKVPKRPNDSCSRFMPPTSIGRSATT